MAHQIIGGPFHANNFKLSHYLKFRLIRVADREKSSALLRPTFHLIAV